MANKIVSKSFISPDHHIPKSKQLVKSYAVIKVLNKIMLQFRTKLITKSLWPISKQWKTQSEQIY